MRFQSASLHSLSPLCGRGACAPQSSHSGERFFIKILSSHSREDIVQVPCRAKAQRRPRARPRRGARVGSSGRGERSYTYVERTAPRRKVSSPMSSLRQRPRLAGPRRSGRRSAGRTAKEAGERAASEAERAEPPRAQLRENIEYVMDGLRSAAARARSQAGSKTRVTYSLPPERDDGYRRGPSVVCATVPQGTVATGPSPRTGSRTSWPGAARLMRHAATKWLCT